MTIRTTRLAWYTGICTVFLLATSVSNAGQKVTPLAVDDSVNTFSGDTATLHIDVLGNDLQLDDGVADLIITTPPALIGTVTKAAADNNGDDGVSRLHVHYTFPAGFGGIETFTYKIESNRRVISRSATVTVDVDGSIAQTASGSNKVVFGGAKYLGSGVALSAVGEEADAEGRSGISSVQCCTVRDPRVSSSGRGKKREIGQAWTSFDLGVALGNDSDCAGITPPAPGTLIVPPHFGVHTDDLTSTDPQDYEFGVCVVETDVTWQGPVQVDVVSDAVVGYPVECKTTLGVHKQPLVLGLSVEPAEFTSPEMRAVTIECDPRSVTRWSRWFFVVNAVHLADKDQSNGYVARMFSTLRSMIEEMRKKNAVQTEFLNDLTSLVLDAQNPSSSAIASMAFLDAATLMALTTLPDEDPYTPNASFSNPKGELVSHLAALRYAVCSELAYPGKVGQCKILGVIDNALPALP